MWQDRMGWTAAIALLAIPLFALAEPPDVIVLPRPPWGPPPPLQPNMGIKVHGDGWGTVLRLLESFGLEKKLPCTRDASVPIVRCADSKHSFEIDAGSNGDHSAVWVDVINWNNAAPQASVDHVVSEFIDVLKSNPAVDCVSEYRSVRTTVPLSYSDCRRP
jgi:hypothetical protein